MAKIRLRGRVGKVHTKNLKTLSKTGQHHQIYQHYAGKPKNTDARNRAAQTLRSARKK